MLGWAIAFFVAAVVAAVLGFGGFAAAFAGIAQILFYLFLVLFVISLIASFFIRPAAHVDATGAHHGAGLGGLGLLVVAAVMAVGVYAWMDNDMSAERLGRMIDRSASELSADAGEAIEQAGERADTIAENASDGVREDTANFLDDAGDNVRQMDR